MANVFSPEGPPREDEKPSLRMRIIWFVGLMLAGLIAVAGAAYLLRALLFLN